MFWLTTMLKRLPSLKFDWFNKLKTIWLTLDHFFETLHKLHSQAPDSVKIHWEKSGYDSQLGGLWSHLAGCLVSLNTLKWSLVKKFAHHDLPQ